MCRLPREFSANKKRGFSVIELMLGVFLMSVVFAGLFVALNIGNFSGSISTAKVDLQAKVRNVVEVIARDVRQTISWEIANNGPSEAYMKFRKIDNWDRNTQSLLLDDEYVEYSYDADTDILTRNTIASDGTTSSTRQFPDITAVPFYTRDAGGGVVPLTQADLLLSRKVVIDINAEARTSRGTTLTYNLTEEVKVRNE